MPNVVHVGDRVVLLQPVPTETGYIIREGSMGTVITVTPHTNLLHVAFDNDKVYYIPYHFLQLLMPDLTNADALRAWLDT